MSINQDLFDSLSSLIKSKSYDLFDEKIGQMCLNKKNLGDKTFRATCGLIYFEYETILKKSHNTTLLDYCLEHGDARKYSLLRVQIFDYALSYNIPNLWKPITIMDINTSGLFIFFLKYLFRICQSNNLKLMNKLIIGSIKITGYDSTKIATLLENWQTHLMSNNKACCGLEILQMAITRDYDEIIDMFARDESFKMNKYAVFNLFAHYSPPGFAVDILRKRDNIFIKKCIVSIIPIIADAYIESYYIRSFCEILRKYDMIHEITFNIDILCELLEKDDTMNQYDYYKAIKIIIYKRGLNIPRKLFSSSVTNSRIVRIKSRLFSYRIMLPMYLLRMSLLPELCPVILNLFVD